MELFDLIQTLVSAHGPSGNEGCIREAIRKLAAPYGGEASTDTMGNLTIHKPGPGPKVMLCAHMDSIGFIVTHIEKEGFLRVGKLGGVAPQEILYTPVRFQNGVRGVVVKEEKASFSKLKLDECYVDIGARDEAQAREMVQIGDTAVYDTPKFSSGGKVISPYLDNRVSCAILLQVLEKLPEDCPNDLYFVFSTQEEVGLRGSKTAAYARLHRREVLQHALHLLLDPPRHEHAAVCQVDLAIMGLDDHPAVHQLVEGPRHRRPCHTQALGDGAGTDVPLGGGRLVDGQQIAQVGGGKFHKKASSLVVGIAKARAVR